MGYLLRALQCLSQCFPRVTLVSRIPSDSGGLTCSGCMDIGPPLDECHVPFQSGDEGTRVPGIRCQVMHGVACHVHVAVILQLGGGASEAAAVAVTGVGDRHWMKRLGPQRSLDLQAAEEIGVASN
ncbi:hypothetical protein TIFTF001_026846 [Ficus carica]|uniref:Uncharacterized protein n=1 Tax=Ficus carica TaxID=3494 RepID=A0AA88IZA5_FICCA|nr:hypothetical protein TIFTF001_026846 [Ficus carica]